MNKPLKYGLFLLAVIFVIVLGVNLLFSLIIKSRPILSTDHLVILGTTALVASCIISVLVIFTAPVLKDFLTTWRTLLRLESLSHPLILKLSSEAPGTYNHSLAVANMAGKVAKAVGANALLARIGGYYHDVGKLANPTNFIENQNDADNPHDELSPKKSTRIIINHVKQGIELAKEYHLPQDVINLIAEHHGTSRVGYFYNKAMQSGLPIKESSFRYPGPKPMDAEGVILMLADAIEAKARLVKNINPQTITRIVDETIQERLDDNQLELSGLNAVKISSIRTSFIEVLTVMYHQRISYAGLK